MHVSKLSLTILSLLLIFSFSGCEDITQFGKDSNTTENNETQPDLALSISEETAPEIERAEKSEASIEPTEMTENSPAPQTPDEPELVIPPQVDTPNAPETDPEIIIPNTPTPTPSETQTPEVTEPEPEVEVLPEPELVTPTPSQAVIELCEAIEITAQSLNVRINPNTSDDKVATVENGEQYVVVGRDGNWVNIWFDEETRWVYGSGYTEDMNLSCGKVINTNSLNVRTGNSTAFDIAGSMKGDSLWVYATQSDDIWKNIWYKSESLWVHGNYLEQQYSDAPSNSDAIAIIVESFTINSDDLITDTNFVTLTMRVNSSVVSYQVSEERTLSGAQWLDYSESADFTLSSGDGVKQLYLRVKDANGRLSEIVSNSIELKVPVVISDGRSIDRDLFYAGYRSSYGGLNGQQVTGLNYLLDNFEEDKEAAYTNLSVWSRQIAYLLATTKHEVANTYTPITEYGSKYCARYDGGCTYKGRGYVQLTHKYNYSAMSAITGANLVDYPTRALEPDIAYTVMSYGSFHGIFTSRKLGDYIKSGSTDYYNARRVINGTDKATLIKGYAQTFQSILDNSAK